MSQAEQAALKIRDQAIGVVMANNARQSGELHTYADARLRIEYCSGMPHALDIWKVSETEVRVFGMIWNPTGDCVVVLHRGGSWEKYLVRLVVRQSVPHGTF
jgi:hypothetical protein